MVPLTKPVWERGLPTSGTQVFGAQKTGNKMVRKTHRYPKTILVFGADKNIGHPTQKPVALFEYLIKTYTLPGQWVLDNCAGSGTTTIACINTNRNYILIEKEQKYIKVISKRILEQKAKTFFGGR